MPNRLTSNAVFVGLAALSVVGLVWGISHHLPAHAQTTDAEAVPETEPATSEPPALPDNFASYTYDNLFLVAFPNGWQTTEQSASPQLILSNVEQAAGPADQVRTEITWFEQPPDVVVPQALQDIQTNGYRVIRYAPQAINGTSALSIWLADLPDELSNAYITYIGYENSTAAVMSYYAESNQAMETLIGNIHSSFLRLEPPASSL